MKTPLPYCPVNITQLILNNIYFFVLVFDDKEMMLGDPFRFLGTEVEAPDDHHPPEKIILRERVGGFPKIAGGDEYYAAGMGLLVGTESPIRYGDSHWRTFLYAPLVYGFFRKLVVEKNYDLYTKVVGPPMPLTGEQRVQRFVLDARIKATSSLFFRLREDSE